MARRRRTGRALPAVAAAGNGVRAAADEIRATAHEFRQFGLDFSVYLKDGAPTLRMEIADSEIERDENEGGKGLLMTLISLFRR